MCMSCPTITPATPTPPIYPNYSHRDTHCDQEAQAYCEYTTERVRRGQVVFAVQPLESRPSLAAPRESQFLQTLWWKLSAH